MPCAIYGHSKANAQRVIFVGNVSCVLLLSHSPCGYLRDQRYKTGCRSTAISTTRKANSCTNCKEDITKRKRYLNVIMGDKEIYIDKDIKEHTARGYSCLKAGSIGHDNALLKQEHSRSRSRKSMHQSTY